MGWTFPDQERVRILIRKALEEDGAGHDRTLEYLGIGPRPIRAHLVARGSGTVAGIEVARMTFEERDPAVRVERRVEDGGGVSAGDLMAVVTGPAGGVLAAERVALNFLQHLCGVATVTSGFVKALAGRETTILDTRKTVPLLRELERYAVRVGGGLNHRFNLSDMILIKENHIRAAGGVAEVIGILRQREAPVAVEVEVDSLDFLRDLLGTPVDRIMLDNFTAGGVRQAVRMVESFHEKAGSTRPEIEVSGGIDLGNVADYAIDGVDFISVGALTHSAPVLDVSLEVVGDDD